MTIKSPPSLKCRGKSWISDTTPPVLWRWRKMQFVFQAQTPEWLNSLQLRLDWNRWYRKAMTKKLRKRSSLQTSSIRSLAEMAATNLRCQLRIGAQVKCSKPNESHITIQIWLWARSALQNHHLKEDVYELHTTWAGLASISRSRIGRHKAFLKLWKDKVTMTMWILSLARRPWSPNLNHLLWSIRKSEPLRSQSQTGSLSLIRKTGRRSSLELPSQRKSRNLIWAAFSNNNNDEEF